MMYKLRPPQEDVIASIRFSVLNGHKRILVSAPTGFGKTILSYEICRSAIEKGTRILFTSHRIQLAEQSRDKFASLNPSYLQGNSDGYDPNKLLTVATLQTLINREIIEPNIVIIDEVHYAYESKLVQSLFEKFPNAIFIGLSATPIDDRGYLLEGFDDIIDRYQIADLINLQWLVPFRIYSPVSVDLSHVKVKGSDYDSNDLEEAVNKPNITNSIVENYIKYGENRKFICFAVNKKHAIELRDAFGSIPTQIIDADTPKAIRENYISEYKAGRLQGLINIEILTAGFDEPSIGCVVLACPTKNWKKFIQCCGRGIRLNGNSYEQSVFNGKSDCILLDCAGAVEEHGMPDTRRKFIFGVKISRVIDRELNLDNIEERKISDTLPKEKQVYLKKIGSLLDLYDGKVYVKEAELQEDVNSFLSKTDNFWWRQNSGKTQVEGRWVHFASKSGLPDNTVFYRDSSLYFGIELKMKNGYLTDHQRKTLPEMIQRGVLFFIAESVYDVYKILEFVESHITDTEDEFKVSKKIYELFEREISLRKKLKLSLPNNCG